MLPSLDNAVDLHHEQEAASKAPTKSTASAFDVETLLEEEANAITSRLSDFMSTTLLQQDAAVKGSISPVFLDGQVFQTMVERFVSTQHEFEKRRQAVSVIPLSGRCIDAVVLMRLYRYGCIDTNFNQRLTETQETLPCVIVIVADS